ncbi:DNA polymerase [Ralstonia phage PQ43W]
MTEPILWADFETASKTDLPAAGLGRYLVDPTTRALCLAFRLPGMQATDLWESGKPFPRQLAQHVERGGLFCAHNAPFDYAIWNEILLREVRELPMMKIQQVRCSAARARYNGLPGSLEHACQALGLAVQKDMEGSAVMKELAPFPERTPATHPEQFARLFAYAAIDVDAMIGLWNATQPLPAREQQFFEMDMRINARGFGCDVDAAQAMEDLKLLAEAQLDYQVTVLTQGGILAVTEIAKIKEYASTFGEEIDDAGKEALKQIAAREDLPGDLRELLHLRLDASRAPKKSAAILRAHVGNRMQHSTIYHGALSGRSTARGAGGVQLLNVARPRPGRSAEDCESYLDACKRHDVAYLSSPEVGPILAALADAQRSLFCATTPGHVLVDADLTGIEARMAPWLANDEEMLQEIEHDIDGYKVEAAGIFGVAYEQVTKDQRQVGKVVRLSLGFGGGDGALVNMAANYGVHLEPELRTEIVCGYRERRPAFERWWAVLEYAALIALDQYGRAVEVPIGRGFCSKITFLRDDRALRMALPSGRSISYHNARLHMEPGASVPLAVYDKPEGYVETLDRKILSNNLTQGLARDLFWEIMVDVDPVEPIVHHVYDQVVLEVPEERAQLRLEQLIARMCITPKWCPGLPVAAAGYVNQRWRKD